MPGSIFMDSLFAFIKEQDRLRYDLYRQYQLGLAYEAVHGGPRPKPPVFKSPTWDDGGWQPMGDASTI